MRFASALVVLWAAVLVGWVGGVLQVEEKTPHGRRLRRIGLVSLVVALVERRWRHGFWFHSV